MTEAVSALLVMDFQAGIVERLGDADVLGAALRAVDAAHASGVRVIYVRVGFRPGAPEVSATNKTFSAMATRPGLGEDDPGTQLHDAFTLQDGDVVVVKRRVSAFTGSDLEVVLRAGRVQHLVLAGISTSGVVLSTLREAVDRDFAVTVLADACADGDPEVHRVLLEKVYPRQAEVSTVDAWVAALGA